MLKLHTRSHVMNYKILPQKNRLRRYGHVSTFKKEDNWEKCTDYKLESTCAYVQQNHQL